MDPKESKKKQEQECVCGCPSCQLKRELRNVTQLGDCDG